MDLAAAWRRWVAATLRLAAAALDALSLWMHLLRSAGRVVASGLAVGATATLVLVLPLVHSGFGDLPFNPNPQGNAMGPALPAADGFQEEEKPRQQQDACFPACRFVEVDLDCLHACPIVVVRGDHLPRLD